MTTGHKITIALAVVLALAGCYALYGWISEREAGLVLATQLKADNAAKATIAQAEAANQANLASTLKQLSGLKTAGQTPQQIVKLAPQVISVPVPIRVVNEAEAKADDAAALPDAPQVQAGDLIVPSADVKPLYDSQVQCKVDAVTLASCQETVTNQKAVLAVNETEIKQQAVALKGGTFWRRTANDAKWNAIGIGLGILIAHFSHK